LLSLSDVHSNRHLLFSLIGGRSRTLPVPLYSSMLP